MKCPRCQNTDPQYFYKGSKGYYCRKCIRFKRILVNEELEPVDYSTNEGGDFTLAYSLTPYQKELANRCIKEIKDSDILLHVVCGGGKTEIVMPLISSFLKAHRKVCYAISRREVVLELSERFSKAYRDNKVIKVCQGFSSELYGDLIVCTTHQLYRYPKSFDLLILDEVDAFPFKGDEVLNNIALTSLKEDGRILYSTATIDKHIQKLMCKRPLKTLSLKRRPHNKPLVEPKIIRSFKTLLFLYLFIILKKKDKQTIIFVESIKICKMLYKILKIFFSITYVYSSLDLRNENIKAFKNKDYKFIIATSVLERGITIEGVDVIILKLYEGIFDKASLIQMSGRVGRSFKDPFGEVLFLVSSIDDEVKAAIKEISDANKVYLL